MHAKYICLNIGRLRKLDCGDLAPLALKKSLRNWRICSVHLFVRLRVEVLRFLFFVPLKVFDIPEISSEHVWRAKSIESTLARYTKAGHAQMLILDGVSSWMTRVQRSSVMIPLKAWHEDYDDEVNSTTKCTSSDSVLRDSVKVKVVIARVLKFSD